MTGPEFSQAVAPSRAGSSPSTGYSLRWRSMSSSDQRSERKAARNSSENSCRLFPGGEMAACVGLVEVDQVVVGLLGPAARRLDVLLGKHRDGGGEGYVGGGVEVSAGLVLLPVEPRRGGGGVGEPVE